MKPSSRIQSGRGLGYNRAKGTLRRTGLKPPKITGKGPKRAGRFTLCALGWLIVIVGLSPFTSAAAQTAAILWALFALPFALYDFVYLPSHNAAALAIDASHLLARWVAAAMVLARFR